MTNKKKYDDAYDVPISNEKKNESKDLENKDGDLQQQDLTESQQASEKPESDDRDYFDMLQRLKAEFENYKKRVRRERIELSDFVKSDLIGKFLPVIDDFERMFDNSQHIEEAQLNVNKLIYAKLITILENEGLEPIDAVGEEFDPEWHEAVVIEKGEDGEDNIVLEEWEKGYLFKSKLLRPAKVKVFKKE